nr:alpha/beta hydrolase [Aliiroseovarius subalbicans]
MGAAALTLLAGAGLTHVLATRREARAAQTHPPTGQLHDIDGIRMHARVMGDGPDLVMIHGSSGNLRDFTLDLAPALAKRYRVILVDRPGLGWSEAHPDGDTLSTQARLIQATVARLGADRPIVLGQSYGGAVGLTWASERPDTLSALVAVSAPAMPWNTGLGTYYTVTSSLPGRWIVIPLIAAFVPEAYVAREIAAVFAPQPAPDGYVEHFGPDLTLRRAALRANAMQRRGLLAQITEMSTHYGRITVPVELLHGDHDTTVPHQIHAAPLAQALDQARLTLLPGVGHMPHHTNIPDVIAAIDRAALRAGEK